MLPIDPKTELIPNPIPLRGKGNSSVMQRKNTEKQAQIPNLARNTNIICVIPKKQASQLSQG